MASSRTRWWVRWTKHRRAWSLYEGRMLRVAAPCTQAEAISLGVQNCKDRLALGQLGELYVCRRDGSIRERRTYGRDPRPRKGSARNRG